VYDIWLQTMSVDVDRRQQERREAARRERLLQQARGSRRARTGHRALAILATAVVALIWR
jgi:hypothetical protein